MLILFCLRPVAQADTLVLRGGRVLQGKHLGGAPDWVIFNANGEVQEIFVSSLITLTFDVSPDRSWPTQPSAAPAQVPTVRPRQAQIVVPAGTRLVVRTETLLASNQSGPGDPQSLTRSGLPTDEARISLRCFRWR